MTPEEIREIRDALGLSRAEFGARLGITRLAVYQWEIGVTHPSHPNIMKLRAIRDSLPRRRRRRAVAG